MTDKKELLKTIIRSFHKRQLPVVFPREVSVPLDLDRPVTVVGVRRSGKTYLLYSVMKDLLEEGVSKTRMVYINFEDDRLLGLTIEDLDLILESYRELYPENDIKSVYFFFDEIQNVSNWENFIRRISDTITKKIFITGSNSKFLSKEIATSMRGRASTVEVFPLNFSEYLSFKNVSREYYHDSSRARIRSNFVEYLKCGGFPEIVLMPRIHRKRALQEYLNVMIYRDIVERHEVSNLKALKFFIKQVVQCHSKDLSVNKIFNSMKSLGLAVGINSLYEYLEYIEDMYLVGVLKKFEKSERAREQREKKVYVIDNGLYKSLSFRDNEDKGKLLESSVYWGLRSSGVDSYLYRGGKDQDFECDFVVQTSEGVPLPIQVAYKIVKERTKERELKGLVESCKNLGVDKGMLLSSEDDGSVVQKGVTVDVKDVVKFFLDSDVKAALGC